jgi:hypothetical protein
MKAHTGLNEHYSKDKTAHTGKIKQTKNHFPVFAKKFRKPWIKLKNVFANFQILGPIGCQGWAVMPKNGGKAKITAP